MLGRPRPFFAHGGVGAVKHEGLTAVKRPWYTPASGGHGATRYP